MSESKPIVPSGQTVSKTMTSKDVLNQTVREVSSVADAEIKTAVESGKGFIASGSEEEAKLIAEIGDNFLHESIVAKPLQIPSYLDVFPKDPTVAFRWVNFKGGEGRQFFFAKSFGFVNASLEDCANEIDPVMVKNQDGGLICGDLLLMKINKLKLFAQYKSNVLKANALADSSNLHDKALGKANTTFNEDLPPEAQRYAGKRVDGQRPRVEFFRP